MNIDVNVTGSTHLEIAASWSFDQNLPLSYHFSASWMTVDAVRLNGTSIPWELENGRIHITAENVDFPAEIIFSYGGNPASGQQTGIHFSQGESHTVITAYSEPYLPHSWIPVPDTAPPFVSGTLTLAVPESMDAVTTGTLAEEQIDGSRRIKTFEWPPDMQLKHLFFSTASGREAHETTLSLEDGDLPFLLHPFPGRSMDLELLTQKCHGVMQNLEAWFGPMDISRPLILILLDDDTIVSSPGLVGFPRTLDIADTGIRPVLANGLAGQWWGTRFPIVDIRHSWVERGLRTYAEILEAVAQEKGIDGSRNLALAGDMMNLYDLGPSALDGPLVPSEGDPFQRPYVLNHKGAYVIHMMRHLVGNDRFFEALKMMHSCDYPGENATGRLRYAMEKQSRIRVADYLDQWVYREDRPTLRYHLNPTGAGVILDMEQLTGTDTGPYRFPIDLYRDGETKSVFIQQQRQRLYVELPGSGLPVLDPNHHILKLAIDEDPQLSGDIPSLSCVTDVDHYPFTVSLSTNGASLMEARWLVNGCMVTPGREQRLSLFDEGTHAIQGTWLSPDGTAMTTVCEMDISCSPDINNDGVVGIGDVARVVQALSSPQQGIDPVPDGETNFRDLNFVVHRLLTRNQPDLAGPFDDTEGPADSSWKIALSPDAEDGNRISFRMDLSGTGPVSMIAIGLDMKTAGAFPVSFQPADAFASVACHRDHYRLLLVVRPSESETLLDVNGTVQLGILYLTPPGNTRPVSLNPILKSGGFPELLVFSNAESTPWVPDYQSVTQQKTTFRAVLPMLLQDAERMSFAGIVNNGNSPADVEVSTYAPDGTRSGNRIVPVPAGGCVEIAANELADSGPTATALVLGSNMPVSSWAEIHHHFNNEKSAYPAMPSGMGDLPVPHIDVGEYWNTRAGVVYTGESETQATFQSATLTRELDQIAGPFTGFHDTFASLLNPSELESGWGMFQSTKDMLYGAEFFWRIDDLHQSAALALDEQTATVFYFPHLDMSGFWWTGISLINPDAADASVTIQAYGASGTQLANGENGLGNRTFTIPAGARRVGMASDFFEDNMRPDAAWVRIDSTLPLTGLEIFGSRKGTSADLSAGLEAVSQPKLQAILPWGTDGLDNQWTGIAILNPDTGLPIRGIELELVNHAGQVVDLRAIHLDPCQKFVDLLRNVFHGPIPVDAAYVRLRSPQPVVCFALHGSDDQQWLMGLNGL